MANAFAGLPGVDPIRRRLLGVAVAMPAVLLGCGRRPAVAAESSTLGQVGRIVGKVALLRGVERLAAAAGTELREGDGVVTGPDARVEIRTIDGSTIVVGPDSSVSLASFKPQAAGAGSALLDLIAGILRITLSGRTPWQSFEVRSATAVASVRSTDWIVDASRAKTGVFVVDGRVAVASRGGADEVILAPGEGTDVLAGRAPTPPKSWGQARIDGVLARTKMN